MTVHKTLYTRHLLSEDVMQSATHYPPRLPSELIGRWICRTGKWSTE